MQQDYDANDKLDYLVKTLEIQNERAQFHMNIASSIQKVTEK